MARSTKLHRAGGLLPLLLIVAATAAGAADRSPKAVAQARELLDTGSPAAAVELLDGFLLKHPDHPEALLLRSTGRIMLGQTEAGKADLERSLKLDPDQRQGWLNRAGVAVAEGDYEAALAAFRTAEKLDRQAPDNDLNIGAMLLLTGELAAASERFKSYLARAQAGAEDFYLVATNYAVAGYVALAIEHLRRAVELDESARLRARTDPNFVPLANHPELSELLATDSYRPPPGAYFVRRELPVAYDPKDKRLLNAVIDALQLSGAAFDPRVEVTAEWALIRGDLRIKVTSTADGQGLVEVSAPPGRLTPAEWQQRTEELFRGITVRLAARAGVG